MRPVGPLTEAERQKIRMAAAEAFARAQVVFHGRGPWMGESPEALKELPGDLIWLAITPGAGLALVGQLLLALRHPENRGPTAWIVREVAETLAAEFRRIDPVDIPAHIKEEIYAEWDRELADLNGGD